MSELLKNGSFVRTFFGGTVKVEKFLAEGSQGEDPMAFYENIKQNVM